MFVVVLRSWSSHRGEEIALQLAPVEILSNRERKHTVNRSMATSTFLIIEEEEEDDDGQVIRVSDSWISSRILK
jgi:hypothetical protein